MCHLHYSVRINEKLRKTIPSHELRHEIPSRVCLKKVQSNIFKHDAHEVKPAPGKQYQYLNDIRDE